AIYQAPTDPMLNWDGPDLLAGCQAAGFSAELQVEHTHTDLRITPALLERWFNPGCDRPSYGDHLAQSLSESERQTVREVFSQALSHQVVSWAGAIALIKASLPI
ncbi:MAG TPA: hypothetical protein V6C88_18275, partial [Chroococcidiopsis sp.]